jgi:NAD(P)-dependent dehydrogenase (short-subunit alcohol dehydrogenase family)
MEPADCERIAQRALAAFGRIDGIVSTVGGFAMGPIAASGPDLWGRVFRLDVLTTLNIFRAVLPPMRATVFGLPPRPMITRSAAPPVKALSPYTSPGSGGSTSLSSAASWTLAVVTSTPRTRPPPSSAATCAL